MTDREAPIEVHVLYMRDAIDEIKGTLKDITQSQQAQARAFRDTCESHRAVIFTELNEIKRDNAVTKSRFATLIAGLSAFISLIVAVATNYITRRM